MSVTTPTVTFEWRVQDEPQLSAVHHGRRLTISPRRVKVVIDHSGICVYIEGRTIKANGDPGQTRRAHWFDENPSPWSAASPLSDLPSWAQKYLDYVLANHEIRRQS